jgi:Protein of unknown function (DUF4232)
MRIAALLAVAAGVTVPGSTAEGRSNDLHLRRNCTSLQLTVHVARWLLGTTHTGGYIAFTNHGYAACRLTGWPTLVGITAAGAKTVAAHVHSTWYGPYVKGTPVLTLRRAQVAEVAFSGSDRPNSGARTCAPSFRHLRVAPPGNTRSVLLSAWFPPLGRYLPNCRGMQVSMVVRPAAFFTSAS